MRSLISLQDETDIVFCYWKKKRPILEQDDVVKAERCITFPKAKFIHFCMSVTFLNQIIYFFDQILLNQLLIKTDINVVF